MKKRGLRRYYRNLAQCKPVLDLLRGRTSQQFGYDYEHFHFDGYPLTRWRAIKAHLDALFRQFEIAKEHITEFPAIFQMWGCVCFQREFGCQVMLYIHTPNSDADDYPADFSNFSHKQNIKSCEITSYLQNKGKEGFTLRYSLNCDNEPEILISYPGIGESVIR